MTKILVVGNLVSTFLYEYVTEVLCKEPQFAVDILSYCPTEAVSQDVINTLSDLGVRVFFDTSDSAPDAKKKHDRIKAVRNVLRHRIARNYDVVHIFGVTTISHHIVRFLRKNTKLIVSYYGSDLMRRGSSLLKKQEILVKRADAITVATDHMKRSIQDFYGNLYNSKLYIAKFGTRFADVFSENADKYSKEQCKASFGMPVDRLCVFCGYNGYPAQRHIEILQTVSALPQERLAQFFFVFHCSYGLEADYRKQLESEISKSRVRGMLVTEFLTGDKLMQFRMCSDIMLNLQKTDVLSASMLECLDLGSIVIVGDWLSYPDLDRNNVSYYRIEKMSEVNTMITSIADDPNGYFEKTNDNHGILKQLLSWEKARIEWIKVFDSVLTR